MLAAMDQSAMQLAVLQQQQLLQQQQSATQTASFTSAGSSCVASVVNSSAPSKMADSVTSLKSDSSAPTSSSILTTPTNGHAQQQQKQQQQQQQQMQQQQQQHRDNNHDDYKSTTAGPEESKTNLIINYLPQNMTQEEVRSLFGSMGEVESCKLVRDKLTGQSLGYGFVNFVRPEDASKAVTTLNGLRLQNKTIKVSHARPSSDSIKGANLYVSGLPKTMTQPELEKMFIGFGSIITSRILCDNVTGLSKGVGFVRFDRKGEAENAINKLNGTVPAGGTDPITVKFANNPAANTQKTALQATASQLDVLQSLYGMQNPLMPNVSVGMATPTAAGLMPLSMLNAAALTRPQLTAAAGGPIHQASQAQRFRYNPMANTVGLNGLQAATQMRMPQAGTAAVAQPSMLDAQALMAQLAGFQNAAALQSWLPTTSYASLSPVTSLATSMSQPSAAAYAQQAAAAAQSQQQMMQPFAQQQTLLAASVGQPTVSVAGAAVPASMTSAMAAPYMASTQPAILPSTLAGTPQTGYAIVVSNLAEECDESLLWQLFGPFGAVLSAKIQRDYQTSKCRGYGFVTMAVYDDAVSAIRALHGTTLMNRMLHISFKAQTCPDK